MTDLAERLVQCFENETPTPGFVVLCHRSNETEFDVSILSATLSVLDLPVLMFTQVKVVKVASPAVGWLRLQSP